MKVLFVTNDPLNQKRSGPAIRCLELARMVAARHEVTIASFEPSDLAVQGMRLLPDALRHKSELHAAARNSDVVVTQGLVLARAPALAKLAKHLVIDLYDPYLLEYLAHAHPRHPQWGYLRQLYRLNQQMAIGDFFVCANQRQWDYWLGRLCALGRLNTDAYQRDSSLRALLDVVPFGLPAEPPQHNKQVMKGVVPGIAKDDFVLLWAGGIWQWLDPLSVIRAVSEAAGQNPRIKLVFMGAQDPNPHNRAMAMAQSARELTAQLGLINKSVFFLDGWVPYEERQNYLLEADVGVSAHPATVESRFAFRTRVLDYLWAGLPMILSQGDDFGDLVHREVLGRAVAPGDVAGWKDAMVHLAADASAMDKARARLRAMAPSFYWGKTAEPLLRYCEQPYKTQRLSGFRQRLTPLLSSGYEIAKGLRG